jgi:hypothetical protein
MRARRSTLALLPLAAGILGGLACDDDTPICVPQKAVACLCGDGTLGVQICAADGLSYGACCVTSPPDAGANDAGP